jgi:quinol-cytochrome oxidoreductase complex cytochrome b subunit
MKTDYKEITNEFKTQTNEDVVASNLGNKMNKKKNLLSKVYDALDERFKLDDLITFMKSKKVPMYRGTIWYYFGGISLLLFIVQVFTGLLLLLYYKGSVDTAFESVQFISSKVQFGWLIRSIHSWAANLMVLSLFIHMFSVFFTKAYMKPRELTWYSGFILFVLTLGFGFTGYLLPWNELAYFATKVGTNITKGIPLIGDYLMMVLRGGEEVTGATLSRFFGIHVALLPGIFTIILALHLIFIQRQGMAEPENWNELPESKRKKIPFFPNFLMRDLLLWLLIINILSLLAVFFPWEIGVKADELAPAPEGIKPEWYFLFMFQVLKYLPPEILFIDGEMFGVILFSLAGLFWFLIPFWDRRTPGGKKKLWITYAGLIAIAFILIFTIIGFIT